MLILIAPAFADIFPSQFSYPSMATTQAPRRNLVPPPTVSTLVLLFFRSSS